MSNIGSPNDILIGGAPPAYISALITIAVILTVTADVVLDPGTTDVVCGFGVWTGAATVDRSNSSSGVLRDVTTGAAVSIILIICIIVRGCVVICGAAVANTDDGSSVRAGRSHVQFIGVATIAVCT